MSSILSRKRDLLFLIFFLTHIPVMLCADLVPLYPASVTPKALTDLQAWYIAKYDDRLFVTPPPWFPAYMYLELFYHLPISVWAVGALLRNDPKVPLHLLIFALETAITTLTCLAEMLSWTTHSAEQKIQLCYLYVPYLALAVFMGVDMFGRLDGLITSVSKAAREKKE